MTGPSHYREAERLLAAANEKFAGVFVLTPELRAELRADALVHATLAQAAATALCGPDAPRNQHAWFNVAGADSDEIGRLRAELAVTS